MNEKPKGMEPWVWDRAYKVTEELSPRDLTHKEWIHCQKTVAKALLTLIEEQRQIATEIARFNSGATPSSETTAPLDTNQPLPPHSLYRFSEEEDKQVGEGEYEGQLQAFKDTLSIWADSSKARDLLHSPKDSLTLKHAEEMLLKINPAFSGAKLGRWLGWVQAAAVSSCYTLTLETMKEINRRYL